MPQSPFRFVVPILGLVCAMMAAYWWAFWLILDQPFGNKVQPIILTIEPGNTIRDLARNLEQLGLVRQQRWVRWYAQLQGFDTKIQAGEFMIRPGSNLRALFNDILAGRVVNYPFTVVEGWTLARVLEELNQHPKLSRRLQADTLEHETAAWSASGGVEGTLFPDTYFYTKGTTDIALLKRAHVAMAQHLATAWRQRDSLCQLKHPFEALILASIIQKESDFTDEYALISGVYQHRLKRNMRLQADPTVVYAIKQRQAFSGRLLHGHLKVDSPYNTYRYQGLPPTPIAIPGKQAVHAALHPSISDALYFVANGAGQHTFSATFEQHLQAVQVLRTQAQ